jgi:hypothetical protein
MTTEEQSAAQTEQPQSKKKKSVKLKSFLIIDFKVIDKLEAELDGNHFIVSAKNGRGKTTLAQALNRNAQRIMPKDLADIPIRVGAKNAQVHTKYIIDEDGSKKEILIETTYRQSGAVTRVIDLYNKGQLTPPVETIQKLLGESHDVSTLMDLTPEDQFKAMLKMLGGKASEESFEQEYDELYQKRKNLNKLIKDDETYLKEIEPSVDVMRDYRTIGLYKEKKPQSEFPAQPDKSALMVEKTRAESHNEKFEEALKKRSSIQSNIERLKKELAEQEERLVLAEKWIAANPKINLEQFDARETEFAESVETFKKQVREFNDYNSTVDKIAAYIQRQEVIESNRKERDEAQAKMKAVQTKMQAAISELKLEEIVPELTIKNELDESGYKPIWRKGIYYKNWDGNLLPFNVRQISYGKMIVALCKLSGYLNYEKFNLFNIPQWNELDKESQEEVMKFVEDNSDLNIQLMIEQVEEKPLGIKIIEKKTK